MKKRFIELQVHGKTHILVIRNLITRKIYQISRVPIDGGKHEIIEEDGNSIKALAVFEFLHRNHNLWNGRK